VGKYRKDKHKSILDPVKKTVAKDLSLDDLMGSWQDEGEWLGSYASGLYGTKVEGQSFSSQWSGRFSDYEYSGWSWSGGSSSKPTVDYEAIRQSIARSANVVSNGDGDSGERNLVLKWTDGSAVNTVNDDRVFVSPGVVTPAATLKPKWTADELNDVLIGEALTESTMKRTMSAGVEAEMTKQEFKDVIDDEGNAHQAPVAPPPEQELAQRLWYTTERMAAEKTVARNYPGFKGYFAAHRKYYTADGAFESVQADLKEGESAANAFAAIQWEMLHPEQHLDMPEETKDVVTKSVRALETAATSENRATVAKAVAREILKRWPTKAEKMMEALSSQPGDGMPDEKRGAAVEAGTTDHEGDRFQCDSDDDDPAPGCGSEKDDDGWVGGTVEHEVAVDPRATALYRKLVRQFQPTIRALRARLKIRNEEHKLLEHGLTRGRVDEGSVYKLGFHATGYSERTLFEREEIKSVPNVAFALLVDESGSMDGARAESARNIAITLVEAIRDIDGVRLCVFGHTGQGGCDECCNHAGNRSAMILHHYLTPKHSDPASLAKIAGYSQNLDGFAIARTGKHLIDFYGNCSVKVLIHISDGMPEAHGYGGGKARRHMARVSHDLLSKGVRVIGIGVEKAFRENVGREMYGPNNFAITDRVEAASVVIGNLITRTIRESISGAEAA